MVTHIFNPNTREVETGGSLWVPGQPGLPIKILFQKQGRREEGREGRKEERKNRRKGILFCSLWCYMPLFLNSDAIHTHTHTHHPFQCPVHPSSAMRAFASLYSHHHGSIPKYFCHTLPRKNHLPTYMHPPVLLSTVAAAYLCQWPRALPIVEFHGLGIMSDPLELASFIEYISKYHLCDSWSSCFHCFDLCYYIAQTGQGLTMSTRRSRTLVTVLMLLPLGCFFYPPLHLKSYVFGCFACLYVMCLRSVHRGQRGHWIPWDWSYRQS